MSSLRSVRQLVLGATALCVTALIVPLEWPLPRSPASGNAAIAAQPGQVQWTPARRGSAGGTLSGGRRGVSGGCLAQPGQTPTSVTLLVPDEQVGLLTTTERPTFSWYVETLRPVTMTFILQDPGRAEPIVTKTLQANGSGLVNLPPLGDKTLTVGTRYRWSVFVACAEGQQGEVVARSFIERIAPATVPPGARNQSLLEQAATYAKAGIWYDAIALLVTEYQNNPHNLTVKAELKSLLQQAVQQPQTPLEQVVQKL